MGLIAYCPEYVQELPENHRFPMIKYRLLFEDLLHSGVVESGDLILPKPVDTNKLETHTSEYVDRLLNLRLTRSEERATGFVHNRALIDRELLIVGGTLECSQNAISNGVSFNLAGGTHHAFTNRGEGFCLLNDQAVAANHLLLSKNADRVLIVDLDVHQGNGTAEIFSDEDRVFTFSMHGKNNYPLRKENSDLDIELDDGTGDSEYLFLLEKSLDHIINTFEPNFIFYQSGADVVESDKLGRLKLTKEGCVRRDELVFNLAERLKAPITTCMGGGYSEDVHDIVSIHKSTIKTGLVLKKDKVI